MIKLLNIKWLSNPN